MDEPFVYINGIWLTVDEYRQYLTAKLLSVDEFERDIALMNLDWDERTGEPGILSDEPLTDDDLRKLDELAAKYGI